MCVVKIPKNAYFGVFQFTAYHRFNVPPEKKFLYALFLALDANFCMQGKEVSSEEKDPSLGDGWSFYGSPRLSVWLIDGVVSDTSTALPMDIDRLRRVDIWENIIVASSGIVTVDCARHNMKRPNAVGDLQLGERYINMDYIFFMGLAGSEISELFVSYDIACQWHKNIWECMKTFPREVRFVRGKQFCVFLITKFHLPAHIKACNILFSFHLTSTVEMGPGMRRNTINDTFNDMNHKKIVEMGRWMLGKVGDRVPELITAVTELEELEESLRKLGAGTALGEWRAEVEAWEADASAPNPFAARVERRTVVQVRGEMAEEVQKEMEDVMDTKGNREEGTSQELHASELIAMGMQLEELQRNLGFDIGGIGNHPSMDQKTNFTERGNKLRCKLLTWMDAQVLARKRIAATQPQPGIQVQHMSLWLPSSICGRVDCDRALYEYEFRLREVQAHGSLDDVRHQLLLRTHLYKHKDAYVRGVKANTRAQTKIEGVEERTRRALVGLGKHLKRREWETELRPLLPEDVRGMLRALFQDPERKKLLMKKGAAARKKFLRWRADWWDQRTGQRQQAPEDDTERVPYVVYAPRHRAYQEGNIAYAKRQAVILRKRAEQFEKESEDVPDFIEMGRSALGDMGDGEIWEDEDEAAVEDEVVVEDEVEASEALNELAVPGRRPAPPTPIVEAPACEENEPVEEENEDDYRDV
ncbi:hypothetical protein C8F04DRAFT_1270138 [Mycena alexandri]|uniref:Uncharacterized protein n=1 Tax=Mycena alexandri TaxID=1745969 RepID=A0AAD6SDB8_9AGAR|nr:hypothetical protein C8F04DRAFT_1270138 [Mycena alexandri]